MTKKLRVSLWLVAFLFGAAGIYVLSVGPAVLLYQRFGLEGHWIGAAMGEFYDPLFELAEKCGDTYPARVFDAYVALFGEDPG